MKKFLKIFLSTVLVLSFAFPVFAQRARRVDTSVRPLSADDAKERWEEFLVSRPVKDYCFKFDMAHLPRKSEAVEYFGYVWGRHLSGGTYSMRLKISQKSDAGKSAEFLFVSKNGVCRMFKKTGGKVEEIPHSDWFKPILDGLVYTPFDFAAPYKKWKSNYAGPGRVGRAVHFFDMRPDAEFAEKNPNLKKVRIALSREFNAPFYTEYYGEGESPERALMLDSIKKIGDVWFMKEIEMQDKKNRDKDKMKIVAIKFFDSLSPEIFDVENFGKEIENPILEEI